MMNSRAITVVTLLALGAAVAGGLASLRRPSFLIEATLARATPLGSTKEAVKKSIESKGWHPQINATGFVKQESGRSAEVVGVTSFEVPLGEYGFRVRTSLVAFWGFDANGRLIEIWVWKTNDAP